MTTIDLNRVAMFVRVAHAGSFTAAARALDLPVSSLSRAVRKLENSLGVCLLRRTTRRLTLTDAGGVYFQRMRQVIGEAESATLAVSDAAAAPSGLVRMTVPSGFAVPHFPRLMCALVQRYPALKLELISTNRAIDLVAEKFDLAIRGGVLGDSSLVARKLAGGELGVFGAPAYLERRGRPETVRELKRHDCLRYRSGTGKFPWRLKGPHGRISVDISGPIVTDDMTFLCDAAVSGAGLALLPIEIAAPALRAGSLQRILPRYRFDGGGTYLVWPSRRLVPARVIAVREFLFDGLRELFAQ